MRFLATALALAACSQPAGGTPEAALERRLAAMSLHQRAAQTVAPLLHLTGDSVPERLRAEVATGAAGALLVRGGEAGRVSAAVERLRAAAPWPLLVVSDLDELAAEASGLPPARFAAALANVETVRSVGGHAARMALAFGADLGVVSLPPLNRDQPMPAASLAREKLGTGIVAYLEGAQEAGLAVSIRAFPRPDTTHLPFRWDRARLEVIELDELARLAQTEPSAVELGYVRLPALTGDTLPLPLSAAAVEGLVRRDLGFDGVVMADLSAAGGLAGTAAVTALAAGVDLLLGVEDPAAVVDAVAAAMAEGRLDSLRVTEAARRVMWLRASLQVDDSVRVERRERGGEARSAGLALGVDPALAAARMAAAAPTPEAADSIVVAFRLGGEAVVAGGAADGDGEEEGHVAAADGEGVPPRRPWLTRDEPQRGPRIGWPPAPVLRMLPADSAGLQAGLAGGIDAIMRAALEDSVFSAGAVAVGRRGGLVVLRGYGLSGRGGGGAPVDPARTIFDLASLTKVIGTTTAAALLVDDGRMDLNAPVRRYLRDFDGDDKDDVRVRHLLTHTSGIPSGLWVFGSAGSPEQALRQVLEQPLVRPPGERMQYSDLGMMLLAAAAESAAGMPLDRFLATRVFAPLGMQSTMYLPPLVLRDEIVPTAEITEREFPLQGIVHDANSFRLGGVAGHAGLFSTARDLAVFAQMMLNGGRYGTLSLLSRSTVEEFTVRQEGAEQRAIGWDTPSRVSSAGAYFSSRSYGHTGYTGTSLWIDPQNELFVVLLTNRTYVEASGEEVLRLRAAVHDAAARAVTDRLVRRRN
jgi:serine-type D-Ala-D-Ala carboxypeptidase